MPYPVPPPEPPAIIYIAKPKKVALTVAAGDGDTRSNPAEIPESSPDIVQPEPTAAPAEPAATLLGTTPATDRPVEMADPSLRGKRRRRGGISASGSYQRTGNCECSARFLVYDLPIGFGRKCHCHSESGTNRRGAEKTGEKSGRKAGKWVSGSRPAVRR